MPEWLIERLPAISTIARQTQRKHPHKEAGKNYLTCITDVGEVPDI